MHNCEDCMQQGGEPGPGLCSLWPESGAGWQPWLSSALEKASSLQKHKVTLAS